VAQASSSRSVRKAFEPIFGMSCVQACQEMVTNAKTALLNLELAVAQLQQLEENVIQEKARLQLERTQLEYDRQQVEKHRENLEVEKASMMKNGVGPNNLVGLNFRGELTVVMKRSTLCQVEGSMLAAMFSGRYENNLDHDRDGNVYVGYPPTVMVPLMDWLTACQDMPLETKFPAIEIPNGLEIIWDGVVKFFGLESVLCPPKVFSGVQQNLKITDLKGWRMAVCKHCTEMTTMADFKLPGVSPDSEVLVGAKKLGKDELILAAIGRLDVIATPGNDNRHHNNVYWSYHSLGFGFSARPFSSTQKLCVQATAGRLCIQLDTERHHGRQTFCFWSDVAECSQPFEKVIMVQSTSGTKRKRSEHSDQ